MKYLIPVLFCLSPLPSVADEPQSDVAMAGRYRECVALVENAPEAAITAADAWRIGSGGIPARHCLALALASSGAYGEAAEELEAIAHDLPLARTQAMAQTIILPSPHIISEMYIQAASAWSTAQKFDRALNALNQAMGDLDKLGDQAFIIYVDRAEVLGKLKRYDEALKDLHAALAIHGDAADVRAMLASAYRYLEKWDLAELEVTAALELDPVNAPALLEQGILSWLLEDDKTARASWLKLIRLHPGTAAARAAHENLSNLKP